MQILTAKQIYAADKATIAIGTDGKTLMENAGREVFEQIRNNFKPCYTVVICGPGNNGGDGFVVARQLKENGWPVDVLLLGEQKDLKGDAAKAAEKWVGEIKLLNIENIKNAELIVDALFGIGLSRPIEGKIARIIEEIKNRRIDVVAVDIPSGINSDTGQIMGVAIEAEMTITFARKKIGHVLYPGRRLCGKIAVVDIGISDENIESSLQENNPELWVNDFPFAEEQQHKYDRGHAVVIGGGIKCTGAASLASLAALHIGAGLVTITCPKNALIVYATKLMSVMAKAVDNASEFSQFINDERKNTILIGPGSGVNEQTQQYTLAALKLKKNCVIDADAITVFKEEPQKLFKAIKAPTVLTPHEGEFKRLFAVEGSKIERALAAAKISGAIVVIKGADTIIAAPDGRCVINTNAPPWLATAGSGDILSGIITGLMANDMDAFKAACAGVWVHGQVANFAGMGMISENMPDLLPKVIQDVYKKFLNFRCDS